MERESFENAEHRPLMNEHFVNIKVDREERPDLDQVYQLAVQLMGRSGGWPLTVFLTPDAQALLRRDLLPARRPPRHARLLQGAPGVAEAYREQARRGRRAGRRDRRAPSRAVAAGEAARHAAPDRRASSPQAATASSSPASTTARRLRHAPKFPNTDGLDVCSVARAAKTTLARVVRRRSTRMSAGGIYDHLGGGFHRYSTDERWLVPHFEKMLYDNALLLRLYADAWRVTRRRALRAHGARDRRPTSLAR